MKKIYTIIIIAWMFCARTANAQEWVVEPVHSSLRFSVNYLGLTKVYGSFDSFNLIMRAQKEDMSDVTVEVTIDVNSIDTQSTIRDEHLKGPEFFNVNQYPVVTFVNNKVEEVAKDHYKLYGDLSIRGITLPVELDVVFNGRVINPMNGVETLGFTVTSVIDRLEFEVGKKGIFSKEVNINADLQLVNR